MNRSTAFLGAILLLALCVWIPPEASGHEQSGSALQLLGFEADLVPAPIDGDIAPDGGEVKWSSAYLRSVTFASVDGAITRQGTIFLTNDDTFLYLGVASNPGSASGQNYAAVYFDQDHDHVLDGSASQPGEYYVKLTGADPGNAENGGWYGANGWQSYGAVFPPGFEAVSQKHGTGNPQTFNFEFKIPLSSLPGSSGESFLDIADSTEIGLMIEIFDTSDGVIMYWEPTGRDTQDPSTWGEAQIGLRGPERQMASSIALGHTPVIDGNVSGDDEWQHYTTVSRSVLLTNYAGDFLTGTLRSKSDASDVYLALEIDGHAATVGDRLNVYLDYDVALGDDRDWVLDNLAEDGVGLVYTGGGLGTWEDLHFDNAPAWAVDAAADGEAAVQHDGAGYEFEMRIPLGGTGAEDLQVGLGALLGMNLEFVDAATGLSFWWDVSTNSRHQQVRVDALNYTALGWSGLQTGAPVVQPVFPRDGDEVSGHYPFTIYSTAASGELGVVTAEFSDDLGLTWKPLTRVDESGLWTRTWDTTLLPDGPREIRLRVTDENDLIGTLVLGVVIDNAMGGAGDRPVVTVSAPAAGSWIIGTTNIEFSVTPAGGQSIVSTEISIDGGPWFAAASPYPWDTTLGEDGSHLFQVRAVQSDSLLGTSDPRLVLVDNTAPEVEALSVRYPAGQSAAKAGDEVLVTALVRDAGAGLDPATVDLDATALDGAMHVLVDDGTNGDEVAGDGLYSRAVTVTSAVTGPVTVSLTAADVLGNVSPALSAEVELDNTLPAHTATVSGDADLVYKNQDVIRLVTTWDGTGYAVTADFSAVDSQWLAGAEQVTDNGDGSYTIVYEISLGNAAADAVGLPIVVTVRDAAGNGPVSHSGFAVDLDNSAPAFTGVDADADYYRNGDMITLTAELDDPGYVVTADFSVIDSEYAPGAETVTIAGNVYTVTYGISALNTIPDGSYDLAVTASDVAGNVSALATSVGLDNTPPELENLTVTYPEGQAAAKAGDAVLVTALVRDDGAGLDPASVVLDTGALDGTSHVLVDDGTSGDAVAGDGLFSFAVTVTSTATGPVTVSLEAQDVLGNLSPSVIAEVELDNADPVLVATSSGDADTIYKNTDVVRLVTTWDGAGYAVTADFSAIDENYLVGAEQVTDNGDGSYTIVYEISFENATADAAALPVAITAWDVAGNGPVVDSGFTVELDNTPPGFASLDADRDNYMDGDTIVLTAAMDDSTYALRCDFGAIDSGYSEGDETVARTGNVYTITHVISADADNTTPDGSYTLTVEAEDVAGNESVASTSVELDNTPEAPVILVPRDGQLLTADVVIDVTCPDDTRFVRFQVSPDDGATWYNLEGTQSPTDYTEDSDAGDGWTQVWSTATDALPDGVAYRIRVTAWDEQNPVAHLIGEDQVGGGLVVDNTPPSLEIAIAPRPTDGPLTGEVYQPEITLTGSFFDLPDSARVVGITIEHRNENGDYVSDSPIHIPATEFTFSRVLRMLEGRNDLVVTATDEAGLTFSRSAEIRYLVPEEAYPIGPEGGTVTAPDGTSVMIPAGALLRTENISIVRVPVDELPPTIDENLTLTKRAHHFGPDGIIFHRPVRITLTYTDADLDRDQDGAPDWDEQSLDAYFHDGTRWVKTNTPDRRPAANSLDFTVNHFSTFDIGVVTLRGEGTRLYWTNNPFRPSDGTTCVFQLPEDGLATLKIFDLAGQRVATVASKARVSASSSFRWDGRNDFDRFVGSGVYVYVFEFQGDEGTNLMFRKPLGVVK